MQMLKIPQENIPLVCMQSFSMVAKNEGNHNTQVEQRKSSQEEMRIQGRFKQTGWGAEKCKWPSRDWL